MNTREFIADNAPAAAKVVGGAGAAAWNLADGQVAMSIAVGAVTLIYLIVQIAYQVWKWRRNARTTGALP